MNLGLCENLKSCTYVYLEEPVHSSHIGIQKNIGSKGTADLYHNRVALCACQEKWIIRLEEADEYCGRRQQSSAFGLLSRDQDKLLQAGNGTW
jgi:hypothetical protein